MQDLFDEIKSGARFSDDRKYRYALWRIWDRRLDWALFIGLNPSTADETVDDPTIRRCVGFARCWGYGGVYMANLFALRATNPRELYSAPDPKGPDNADYCTRLSCARRIAMIITCWGNHGRYMDSGSRFIETSRLFPNDVFWKFHHLGLTKAGQPKHPLYLPKITKPVRWQ